MSDQQTPKKSKLRRVIFFLLFILIVIPLLTELVFFLIRLSPGAVIPDNFALYVKASSPVSLGSKILAHESLPELMVNPALASLTPALSGLRSGALLENPLVRIALRGSISAAVVNGPSSSSIIAAWDSAFLSPLLPLLPLGARLLKNPNLFYVEGTVSRFEYRSGESVFYIGRRRNLLIFSNDEALFNQALSPEGAYHAPEKGLTLKKQDLSLLIASKTVTTMLAESNPILGRAFAEIELPQRLELGINIAPKQLDINMVSPVDTSNGTLEALLGKNSVSPSLMNLLPDTTQYCTGLSALALRDLIEAAAEFQGGGLRDTLATADKTARTLLGLTLEDLLYSWTAEEYAVFGLEDRPAPIFAVKIEDEAKRQAVFDKVFKSLFVRENSRLVLDGNRIPQIELPPFVDAILRIIQVRLPEPYYTVHEGWLLLSESPENILATVNAVRQNQLLARTPVWQKLTGRDESSSGTEHTDNASLSLFYSLNRSLPFFLKGGSAAASILRMYRRGLLRVSVKDNVITVSLSVEPGSDKGLESIPGYPISLGRKTGNAVYAVLNSSGSESRLLLSREHTALSVNPADHKIYELAGNDPVWVIPAEGLNPKTLTESAAWVVSSRGLVTLANGNMEVSAGFPVITGLKLNSAPAARNGKLYLSAEEAGGKGILVTVDSSGHISRLEKEFDAPLLSPPSFLEIPRTGRSGGETVMALYPKSFLGELYLCDEDGNPKPGWPQYAPDIAFGSPVVFLETQSSRIITAFITMPGELTLYSEQGSVVPGFPLELKGVFYLQPIWDGEYLWIVSGEGTLYRVDLNGRIMQQSVPDLSIKDEGRILCADVDGDGIAEIFVTGEGNALYGYSRNLISIEGFPLPVWGQPVFADLDGDGIMDCTGAGMDDKLYRWRFNN